VGPSSVEAAELLSKHLNRSPAGLISNENGPVATVNGWLQSAMLGIPVIDAPCNGRAHPLSTMGAIGLHLVPGYVASAAAGGGNAEMQRYFVLDGSVEHAGKLLRQAAVEAGGFAAIARNPTTVGYVRTHAAVGALSQAINLGSKLLGARDLGPREMIEVAAPSLNGRATECGIVGHVTRSTRDGYDIGDVLISTNENTYGLKYCNEYLTLEVNGHRLASFPDLITLLWIETGLPVASAEVTEGMEVSVAAAIDTVAG
jgi:DUF917 family protein